MTVEAAVERASAFFFVSAIVQCMGHMQGSSSLIVQQIDKDEQLGSGQPCSTFYSLFIIPTTSKVEGA